MKKTLLERFAEKILITNDCWLWTGSIGGTGYGNIHVCGTTVPAHRLSYEIHIGFIPKGLCLDHLCRVRRCVNPWHLEAVTLAENKRRGMSPNAVNARKTHCMRGHPFDSENTRIVKDGRDCRECRRTKTRIRQKQRYNEDLVFRAQLLEYQRLKKREYRLNKKLCRIDADGAGMVKE